MTPYNLQSSHGNRVYAVACSPDSSLRLVARALLAPGRSALLCPERHEKERMHRDNAGKAVGKIC